MLARPSVAPPVASKASSTAPLMVRLAQRHQATMASQGPRTFQQNLQAAVPLKPQVQVVSKPQVQVAPKPQVQVLFPSTVAPPAPGPPAGPQARAPLYLLHTFLGPRGLQASH